MEVEIWVMMDADGDYEVGKDKDDCGERFSDNIGGCGPRRMVQIKLFIPKPKTEVVRLVAEVGIEETGVISVK